MRVKVHRGTKEIGGSCIELEAGGERLLLDLGLPLDGDPEDISVHPAIDGLDGQDSLRALVLSHGHLDHWGLAHLAGKELPVALGAISVSINSARCSEAIEVISVNCFVIIPCNIHISSSFIFCIILV